MIASPAASGPGDGPDRDSEPPTHRQSSPRSRRRIILLVLLLVVPFLLIEAGVRILIAIDRLPVAAAHTDTTEVKWARLARAGKVDILLVGPSTMNAAIDPAILGDAVGEALGRKVRVFNLGIPSLVLPDPGMLEALAREARLPPLVIFTISPGIRDDATDEPVVGGATQGGSSFTASPMGQLVYRCEGVSEYVPLVDCAAGLVSAAWRWRGRPQAIVGALVRSRSLVHDEGRRRIDGFGNGRPAPLAEIEAQIPTVLERDPGSTRVGQRTVDRFRRSVEAVRAAGGTAIGLLIPYTPPLMAALEEAYPGFQQAWLDGAATISREAGLPVIDPGPFGAWFGDGSGQDIKHLSREGASDFTAQVWSQPELAGRVVDALGGPPGSAARPSPSSGPGG